LIPDMRLSTTMLCLVSVHANADAGSSVPGRHLGHGGPPPVTCTGCSTFHVQPTNSASRYKLTTLPHRSYGAGMSPVTNLTNVEMWVVDCVYLKCAPMPACPSSGRRLGHGGGCRRLGHGGGSAVTAPAGWVPDPSANATLADFCDLRTMVNFPPVSGRRLGHGGANPNAGRRVVGMVFHSGFLQTCVFVPRTAQPLIWAKESGLLGLLFLTVTDPVMMSGHVHSMIDGGNPVPDFPVLVATSTNVASSYTSSYTRSSDSADLIALITIVLTCNAQTTSPARNLSLPACDGSTQTMYADLYPELDDLNVTSSAAVFLYYVVGIGFLIQIVFVVYVALSRRKQLSLVQHSVLITEGFVCAALRTYRQIKFPTAGGFTANVSYLGMWFLDAGGSLESSLSAATTFMTIAVYVKLLFAAGGCALSAKKSKIVDVLVLLVSFLLGVTLTFLSILYPFQPWLVSSWSWLSNLGNQNLKKISYQPAFVLNIIFASMFIACSFAAIVMMARVARTGGSSKIMSTVKKVLKYILMQVVGLVLVVVSIGMRANWTLAWYYSLPNYTMYWIQFQFQGWGNLLSSWGAVMTIVHSSSSSSSSSSI